MTSRGSTLPGGRGVAVPLDGPVRIALFVPSLPDINGGKQRQIEEGLEKSYADRGVFVLLLLRGLFFKGRSFSSSFFSHLLASFFRPSARPSSLTGVDQAHAIRPSASRKDGRTDGRTDGRMQLSS